MITPTPYHMARQLIGQREHKDGENPLILAMLRAGGAKWPSKDEVPWCSAFVYSLALLWDLPRPGGNYLRARSWLNVGQIVPLEEAESGFDIVILKRGGGEQPPAHVTDAPGHVGFYVAHHRSGLMLLGGNQGDQVSIDEYLTDRVLGVRRLLP